MQWLRGERLNGPDERDQRIRQLEDCLERLSEAGLRINESLDFDTVLQKVVDSARALTASRYGALTIPGEVFRRPTFIASGLTREEFQGFLGYAGGIENSSSTPAGWKSP